MRKELASLALFLMMASMSSNAIGQVSSTPKVATKTMKFAIAKFEPYER
jgi:hypothetical protein